MCHGCGKSCCRTKSIAKILLVIGGLNWGLIGIGNLIGGGNWDIIAVIFGSASVISSLLYLIVGLSTVYILVGYKKCKQRCKMEDKSGKMDSVPGMEM